MGLTQNKQYIIQGKRMYNTVRKIKVLELTKKTIFIENLDFDSKVRYLIGDFNYNWQIIEEITE